MDSREAVEKILSQRNHMIEGYEVRVEPLTKDADVAV